MPTEQIKHWFLPLVTFHIATAMYATSLMMFLP